MKRNYTIFSLLISFSIFAQNNKVRPSSSGDVAFREVDGKIELLASNSRSGVPSSSSFSSPNDVIMTQDELGNKYWYIIDGTIVKSEIVTRTGITSYDKENSQPAKEAQSSSVPEKTVIYDSKKTELIEVPETKGTQATDSQIKIITTETKKIEDVPVQKQIDNPVVDTKSSDSEGKTKQIIIEEIEEPAIQTQPVETNPKVTESSDNQLDETIQITKDDVGNTSDLFEKNYEDMSRKEKKLYKKNEKKIMKQLEKELKNQKDSE
ncbi:hypothetical protein O2K51_12470 [Apibacter raozihei]|uniref:hypothetical protein n=1 Tax=Apibacter raozihei TaxID=2500547 RepID=UPI000FE3F7AD|nr:hypothetical protein [Apibacter raozihei]